MFFMLDIHWMNISAANLNLFVAFDALIAANSVSRAAKQVGITQSAMSNSLRNLRALFGDPLFLRAAHGIVPTPRARELAGPVREALRLLERTLAPRQFDPAASTRTFVLITSDYVEFVLLPRLLARVRRQAPGVRLQMLPWVRHQVPEDIARGTADLMIGFYDQVPNHHRDTILFEERYACIVRRGHPQVRDRLTLRTYAGLEHIMVSLTAGASSGIDRALAARGHSRVVAIRVSHFLNVPPLVASTDLVASLSRRVAEPFARMLPLRLFDPPLRLRPSRVGMVWHDSVHDDPAHRWLRSTVAEVCAEV
jgi:DNA-binding transcriptional LysR family regulator